MHERIQKVAKLLMYDGPSVKELIKSAVNDGKEFEQHNNKGFITLTIKSSVSYSLKLTDIYTYNQEGQLIKQVLKLNDKEKVIFDKFQEAKDILNSIESEGQLVS
jgi:GTP cyclohydrolase FolE2